LLSQSCCSQEHFHSTRANRSTMKKGEWTRSAHPFFVKFTSITHNQTLPAPTPPATPAECLLTYTKSPLS
jgi:hypothetical protein